MTNIPGLARFEWTEAFWEDADIAVVVEGDHLHLEFVGSALADWTLTATYRGQSIEISAQQQHDKADFGVITFPGTARLFTDSSLVRNHPSFAVNALVMNAPKPD
ncbi:hypothetical protein AB0323_16605 [Arthrobacter sp. NPDC080031]|uniref:hypothetical protein n=1 Tax=Arthrobacter sp. NPDC080031 TaxID=3155918 RepID=UPI003450578E